MSDERKVGIVELLTRIGDDRIKLQSLDQTLLGARLRKGGITEICFGTDSITPTDLVIGENKLMGLVLWLEREDVDKALKEAKGE